MLSSSLFILAPVYHCSLVVLLHCAVSWITKQHTHALNTKEKEKKTALANRTIDTLVSYGVCLLRPPAILTAPEPTRGLAMTIACKIIGTAIGLITHTIST